jgi:hypothetical protein
MNLKIKHIIIIIIIIHGSVALLLGLGQSVAIRIRRKVYNLRLSNIFYGRQRWH